MRGPWPPPLYLLAAAGAAYLLVRTAVVLRRDVPRSAEYVFVLIDAAFISVAIRLLSGIDADFYLAYFLVLGEAVLTLDLLLVEILGLWIAAGYVWATWPAVAGQDWGTVVARLFFVLLAGVGAAWVAVTESARLRELGVLQDQLRMEGERRRIAQEIHDGVGHALATGSLAVELAERLLPRDPQRVAALLPEVKALFRRGLDEIRLLMLGLQPAGPSVGDAVEAIRQHLSAFAQRTDIRTELRCEVLYLPLSPASEFTLRRLLQEALTNTARHAHAGRVTVTLVESDGSVTCSVIDDGIGFASGAGSQSHGFGLQHMRQRAEELGGTVDVISTRGGGTTVTFTLPRIVPVARTKAS
jgi:signal transduction histidine kinase